MPARKTLAVFRARRQTHPVALPLAQVTVAGRIMKNRSFVDIPLSKRRKKSQRDGLERWTDTNNELPANLTSLPLVQKSSNLGGPLDE